MSNFDGDVEYGRHVQTDDKVSLTLKDIQTPFIKLPKEIYDLPVVRINENSPASVGQNTDSQDQSNQNAQLRKNLCRGNSHENADKNLILMDNSTDRPNLEVNQHSLMSLENENTSDHSSVIRQVSTSSLCSWSSFDTAPIEDSSSDAEINDNSSTGISFNANKKV